MANKKSARLKIFGLDRFAVTQKKPTATNSRLTLKTEF